MEALTDPASLRETEVEHVEREPEVNESHYAVYEDHAGTVVVGTTDERGQLALLEHPESGGLAPSFARVKPGADYLAAGREAVRDGTGLDVRIDAVVRVRGHVYRTPDGRETTGRGTDRRRRDRPRGGPRVAGRHDPATVSRSAARSART
jgi:hypothetical protein